MQENEINYSIFSCDITIGTGEYLDSVEVYEEDLELLTDEQLEEMGFENFQREGEIDD